MSNTETFTLTTHPTPLVTPKESTPIRGLELNEEHKEQKRLCLECKNVENELLRHI